MKARNIFGGERARARRPGHSVLQSARRIPGPGLIAIFLAAIFLQPQPAWSARTVRVNADGTAEFTSVQAAVNALQPGDECLVAPGHYPERVRLNSNQSGRAESITVLKADGAGVSLLGFEADASYVRIEGFVVVGGEPAAGNDGFQVRGTQVQLSSNVVRNFSGAGIIGNGIGIVVEHNHILRCGIGIAIGGSGWRVIGNRIERLAAARENDGVHVRVTGTDHVLRNNRLIGTLVSETGGSPAHGFEFVALPGDLNGRWILENNRVEGHHSISVRVTGTGGAVSDVAIRNNIFVAPAEGAIDAERSVQNLRIFNNTIVNPRLFGIRIRDQSRAEVKNNVFFSDAPPSAKSDLRVLAYRADEGSQLTGESNLLSFHGSGLQRWFPKDIVMSAPPFVSVKSGNYRLRPGSPGIDGGVMLSEINTDIEGLNRPQGPAWDIGAYEFPYGQTNRPAPPGQLRISVN